MKNYKYILFDLDGTLTDPAIGITNGVMYSLSKFGIEVTDRTELYKFIGPPAKDCYRMFYNFSEEQVTDAVKYYRAYYAEKGKFENKVYDNIPKLLQTLKEHNKKLFVATSKPEIVSKEILEHFNLSIYFDFIGGSNMDGTRANKDEVISYVLKEGGIDDLESALMIGDREYDISGANKIGIDSVGVLYGYGNRTEFEDAGATYIVDTVDQISELIL